MGTVQTGADESHFQFNCERKMQITLPCDSLYDCCWFPALLSGQEPHDPHQTSKSSQWFASYWVHYSKSTAVIWIDRLGFDSRRDVPKLCACVVAAGDALIFPSSSFLCSPYLFCLIICFYLPIYHHLVHTVLIYHSYLARHYLFCSPPSVLCTQIKPLFPFQVNYSSSLYTSPFMKWLSST